ncbi:ferroxidase fet3 [Rhizophlyctis rosea]|uniref:Ferroxidase fet3 n=1 Tax=Rhizophlyctis rosea TaxID=64517 RepID=A0AAD5SJ88_9FUNG|nr:ferroxidase fet3 [Rhizophlyctis rosea]
MVQAAVRTFDYDITYVDNVKADGLKERRVIGVNGKWPPPPIEAWVNDTIVINVKNSLDVITGLHSHGMFQNGTAWMDGAVGTTQCGIPPGQTYTYRYNATQHGTYWFHSHFMGQYVDGLRGPLIIHPAQEAYQYDEDYTIAISDWYFQEYQEIMKWFFDLYNPTGIEPSPDSGTLLVLRNASYVDAKQLSFTPGKTYRIRFINMSAFAMFHVGISGHDMEIIEVDGVDVNRTKSQGFDMTIAQRYSVLVRARNDTSTNFNIHADMDISVFSPLMDTLQYNMTVPIIYNSSAPSTTEVPAWDTTDDLTLSPLVVEASIEPDVTHEITASMGVMTDGLPRAQFNDVTFIQPQVPSILTALTTGADANNSAVYGKQTNALVMPHNKMIQLVINNNDGGPHPFHLHGHVFQILNRSDTFYDANVPLPSNPNPVRRDTVLIPPNGSVVLQYRADNPGAWLFHCHIQWHMDQGLIMLFIEAPEVLQQRLGGQVPSYLTDQCKILGKPVEGNAIGKAGLDLKGEPEGPYMLPDGFTTKGKIGLAGTIVCALLGLSTVWWFGKSA